MTQRVAANTLAGSGDPYASEAQEMLEDFLNGFKEIPGAQNAAAKTIASGAFSISNAAGTFELTSESGSADDLTTITGSFGTVGFDDQFIALIPASGHTITVKHNTGGAGKIMTASGNDVVLASRSLMLLRAHYGGGTEQWEEIAGNNVIARQSKMLGCEDLAALTLATDAVIPTVPINSIDTEGGAGTDNFKWIDPTNDVKLLLLTGANDSHVVTIKDYVASSISGDGKISLSDATDRVLSTSRWVLLRKTGAAGSVIWKEIPLGSNSSLPTIQEKSADFTAYPGYHYLVDASSDVVATLVAAGGYIGQEATIEQVAGTGEVKIVPTGSETFANAETLVTLQEIGAVKVARAIRSYSAPKPQTYSLR